MARAKRTKPIPSDASKVAPAPSLSASAIPPHVSSPKSNLSNTTSDDSDGLVVRRPGAIRTRNPLHRMSGAQPSDAPALQAKPIKSARPRAKKEKTRIAREDDAGRQAIENMRRRMEADEKVKALGKSGPRQSGSRTQTRQVPTKMPAPPATLQVERSQPEPEPESEVEVARYVAPGSAWKRAHAVPMSARKPISTPHAEASMLALANFPRRVRAPSILGIGGHEDDTASISSGGSFGDLVPDEESTPLPRMRQPLGHNIHNKSPASGDAQARSSSSKKRKRGSNDFQVPNSQPDGIAKPPESSPTRAEPIEIPSDDPDADSDASLPELPVENAGEFSHTPNSTMAPPASSSPIKPTANLTQKHSSSPLQGRTRGKTAEPGIAKVWNQKRGAKKPSKVMDSAMLQDLLPKRRVKAQTGDFSIWSSDGPGAGTDDDELSFAPTKKRRGTNNRSRQTLSEKKSLANSAKPTKKRSNLAAKNATPVAKTARTYSRRQSDQENNVTMSSSGDEHAFSEVDDITEASPVGRPEKSGKASKVLDAMAKKFADVDNWEMEFEEASGSSDALKNAR